MKHGSRRLLWLVPLVAVSCSYPTLGPPPPTSPPVQEVRVEALPPAPPSAQIVSDPAKVRSIARSYAVSANGWVESHGRELLPLYRIDFVAQGELRATYWLGTNSHPPRFPCYSFCSGWWVAPSNATGAIDTSRYKGLPDSVYFYFLADLGIH
jgi:hypothetical protein